MKKIFSISVIIIALLFFLSGCVSTQTKGIWQGADSVENEYFHATFWPLFDNKGYALTIRNKTEKDLELNWDKTLYMLNGRTKGRFMLEGAIYRDRNNSKPNDIIFPGGKLVITVWPSHLVRYVSGRYGGWKHDRIEAGSVTGAYLTIMADGVEINEQMTGTMRYVKQ